jgi:hypothetical protein
MGRGRGGGSMGLAAVSFCYLTNLLQLIDKRMASFRSHSFLKSGLGLPVHRFRDSGFVSTSIQPTTKAIKFDAAH